MVPGGDEDPIERARQIEQARQANKKYIRFAEEGDRAVQQAEQQEGAAAPRMKVVKRRWLTDFVRELKAVKKMPGFRLLKPLENGDDSDEDVQVLQQDVDDGLTELPRHVVQRLQLMESVTASITTTVSAALDTDNQYTKHQVENMLQRLAESQQGGHRQPDADLGSDSHEFLLKELSRMEQAAIVIQRAFRVFRAKCLRDGWPSEHDPLNVHKRHEAKARYLEGMARRGAMGKAVRAKVAALRSKAMVAAEAVATKFEQQAKQRAKDGVLRAPTSGASAGYQLHDREYRVMMLGREFVEEEEKRMQRELMEQRRREEDRQQRERRERRRDDERRKRLQEETAMTLSYLDKARIGMMGMRRENQDEACDGDEDEEASAIDELTRPVRGRRERERIEAQERAEAEARERAFARAGMASGEDMLRAAVFKGEIDRDGILGAIVGAESQDDVEAIIREQVRRMAEAKIQEQRALLEAQQEAAEAVQVMTAEEEAREVERQIMLVRQAGQEGQLGLHGSNNSPDIRAREWGRGRSGRWTVAPSASGLGDGPGGGLESEASAWGMAGGEGGAAAEAPGGPRARGDRSAAAAAYAAAYEQLMARMAAFDPTAARFYGLPHNGGGLYSGASVSSYRPSGIKVPEYLEKAIAENSWWARAQGAAGGGLASGNEEAWKRSHMEPSALGADGKGGGGASALRASVDSGSNGGGGAPPSPGVRHHTPPHSPHLHQQQHRPMRTPPPLSPQPQQQHPNGYAAETPASPQTYDPATQLAHPHQRLQLQLLSAYNRPSSTGSHSPAVASPSNGSTHTHNAAVLHAPQQQLLQQPHTAPPATTEPRAVTQHAALRREQASHHHSLPSSPAGRLLPPGRVSSQGLPAAGGATAAGAAGPPLLLAPPRRSSEADNAAACAAAAGPPPAAAAPPPRRSSAGLDNALPGSPGWAARQQHHHRQAPPPPALQRPATSAAASTSASSPLPSLARASLPEFPTLSHAYTRPPASSLTSPATTHEAWLHNGPCHPHSATSLAKAPDPLARYTAVASAFAASSSGTPLVPTASSQSFTQPKKAPPAPPTRRFSGFLDGKGTVGGMVPMNGLDAVEDLRGSKGQQQQPVQSHSGSRNASVNGSSHNTHRASLLHESVGGADDALWREFVLAGRLQGKDEGTQWRGI